MNCMRFEDLFNDYKDGLKDIERFVTWKEIPLNRKIFIFLYILSISIGVILGLIKKNQFLFWGIFITSTIFIIIIPIIINLKNTKTDDAPKKSTSNFKERISMTIKVLENYGINIENLDSINLLIEEAKILKEDYDYLKKINLFNIAFDVFIGIISYISSIFIDKFFNLKLNEILIFFKLMLYIICILMMILIGIFLFHIIIKYISPFYTNYNKCEQLIYDLRQIKIFYKKKSNQ